LKRHAKPEGRRNLPAHLAAYERDCGRLVTRPARTELAAPRNFNQPIARGLSLTLSMA
jgi:hypothetical protein